METPLAKHNTAPIDVAASREERLKRQQSRFRDRGGTFVPSGHNPLIEQLLAMRPNRARSRSRSRSVSPKKAARKPKKKASDNDAPQPSKIKAKARAKPKPKPKAKAEPKSKAAPARRKQDAAPAREYESAEEQPLKKRFMTPITEVDEEETQESDEQPQSTPSKHVVAVVKPRKRPQPVEDDDELEAYPPPKRAKRTSEAAETATPKRRGKNDDAMSTAKRKAQNSDAGTSSRKRKGKQLVEPSRKVKGKAPSTAKPKCKQVANFEEEKPVKKALVKAALTEVAVEKAADKVASLKKHSGAQRKAKAAVEEMKVVEEVSPPKTKSIAKRKPTDVLEPTKRRPKCKDVLAEFEVPLKGKRKAQDGLHGIKASPKRSRTKDAKPRSLSARQKENTSKKPRKSVMIRVKAPMPDDDDVDGVDPLDLLL